MRIWRANRMLGWSFERDEKSASGRSAQRDGMPDLRRVTEALASTYRQTHRRARLRLRHVDIQYVDETPWARPVQASSGRRSERNETRAAVGPAAKASPDAHHVLGLTALGARPARPNPRPRPLRCSAPHPLLASAFGQRPLTHLALPSRCLPATSARPTTAGTAGALCRPSKPPSASRRVRLLVRAASPPAFTPKYRLVASGELHSLPAVPGPRNGRCVHLVCSHELYGYVHSFSFSV
ncbi:hypothetical protein BDY21DRAFT_16154 [Lineolata rhizophorae]|uniref:Uncharacterized protein n=1 Tax=Lineolata rhizophorae TaxID=578093 RepID=A0A6A6P185_9PEZI|nr:hypothetical protein BDY21DRAFT_16154 [Lineolata rhizophorae]